MTRATITTLSSIMLLILNSLAQSFIAPLQGEVLDLDQNPIPNTTVIFFENNYRLDSTQTDSLGQFEFITEFKNNKEYSILIKCYTRNDFPDIIREKSDTSKVESYYYEFTCNRRSKEQVELSYDFNSLNKSEDLDLRYFKSLLDEYPKLCLELRQKIDPEEDLEIAKTRFVHINSELIRLGCDMDRISVSSKIIVRNKELLNDKRSIVEAVVLSNDGNCNK